MMPSSRVCEKVLIYCRYCCLSKTRCVFLSIVTHQRFHSFLVLSKYNNFTFFPAKMPISDNDSISEHSDSDGSDTVIRSGTSAKSPKVKATQRRPTKNTSKPTGASKAKTKNKKISAPAGREQLVKHLLQNMNAGLYRK